MSPASYRAAPPRVDPIDVTQPARRGQIPWPAGCAARAGQPPSAAATAAAARLTAVCASPIRFTSPLRKAACRSAYARDSWASAADSSGEIVPPVEGGLGVALVGGEVAVDVGDGVGSELTAPPPAPSPKRLFSAPASVGANAVRLPKATNTNWSVGNGKPVPCT